MKKNVFRSSLFCSLFILGFSCTTGESLENINLEEESNLLAKSSQSVELSIASVSAEITNSGYPANNVLDGNTSTRWSGQGEDVEFYINLETKSLIDYLSIAFPSGNSRQYGYVIFTSKDNYTWTQVKDSQSSGNTSNLEEIDVANTTGKYIKIVLEGSDVNNWNYISRLEVYGTQSDDDVTDSDEPSDITIIDTINFGDLEVETSWKSKEQGNRDVFEASEVDEEEWMDVMRSGKVMMKCLSEDSHRTELKERSGKEASLNKYKKMSYVATFVDVPENGVTIAQVHNRGGVNRPWIRVYIDEAGYIKIKETATTPDKSKSTYKTYEGPKYISGDELSVSITINKGQAYFKIITNNNTFEESLSPSDDWDYFSNHYYLKAGVYTEGNDTEPVINFISFSLDY